MNYQNLPKTITDLIWIHTAFLGDLVLLTSALDLVKKQLSPSIKQRVITTSLGRSLYSSLDTHLSSVHVFEKKRGGLKPFLAVKDEIKDVVGGYPVILQPHRSLRSTLLCRYLGFPAITFEETVGSFCHSRMVPRIPIFHEAVRVSQLLEPLGVSREDICKARPFLPAKALPSDLTLLDALKEAPRPWIGLAPGSVWGTKRWPEESFAQLGERLLKTTGGTIVLLGSDQEKTLCHQITAHLPSAKNFAGSTLDDARWIFPQLDLLVALDSAPTHFGSAFNIPTVTIFGATTSSLGFAPLADSSAIEGISLDCRPCSSHGPMVCPLGHFHCMKGLSVDQVFRTAMKLLGMK